MRLERPAYSETRDQRDDRWSTARPMPSQRLSNLRIGSDERKVSYVDASGATVTLDGTVQRERSPIHEFILFAALALIVAGVGFLKPNISTCVGALYDAGRPATR